MLRRCDFKNQSLQSLGNLLGRQLTASAMAVVSSVHKVRQSKLYLVAALVANTNITNTNRTSSNSQTNTTTILRKNSDTVFDKQRNNIGVAECNDEEERDDNDFG